MFGMCPPTFSIFLKKIIKLGFFSIHHDPIPFFNGDLFGHLNGNKLGLDFTSGQSSSSCLHFCVSYQGKKSSLIRGSESF
jgi:hypothetical protein